MADRFLNCPCTDDDGPSPPPRTSAEWACLPAAKYKALVAAAKHAEACLSIQSYAAQREGRDGLYLALKEVRDRLAAALKGIQ